ncbi:hypothetical protein [Carboxylicivirga sp. M1479]|uniref:hypothetical protein n=1 Tax=Carboxylicivirga sp. M1479 TaxID=2594476 RepID=UPI0011782775|nr:hypothetical protein [Carboxylicivirga sp. M1479]TRX71581.1 hypothetical protein FNN09_06300 [Carboxylicivirga sp. M1479]
MKMFKFFGLLLAFAVAFTACNDDDDNGGPEEPLVEDGVYLVAPGSAADVAKSAGKFVQASNENDMDTDRPSLMEIYMPIEGGTTFTIYEVAGATKTTYGSADITAVDKTADGENSDQPASDFWRGTLSADAAALTIAESGMYHIFLDKATMKVGYAKAEWGAIGSAWPDGWGSSTAFTEGAFDKEMMTWTISDVVVKASDWKFRYSNAWKAFLDYETETSPSKNGVAVNTNFGGTLDNLEAGASNIVTDEGGMYDMTLTWELGSGYSAVATRTGDLPLTDWSAVAWDAVGTAVSLDNPNAADDESGWNWGNVLVADNSGLPTKNGDVYTYTWAGMVIEKEYDDPSDDPDQGAQAASFKLRVKDGAGIDVGYDKLDVDASSTKVVDAGNNLSVSEKGTFTITLTIDAGNEDAVTVVITE